MCACVCVCRIECEWAQLRKFLRKWKVDNVKLTNYNLQVCVCVCVCVCV